MQEAPYTTHDRRQDVDDTLALAARMWVDENPGDDRNPWSVGHPFSAMAQRALAGAV